MDMILAVCAFELYPQWISWTQSHFDRLVWLLAPGQVLATYCMALAFEFPKIPKWAKPRWRPVYRVVEVLYGVGFVLSVGALLWHYLFVPKHPLGAAWALGLTLFGSLLAFASATEARFGDIAWWRKLPIWGFLFLVMLMLEARALAWPLRFAVLTLAYLPLRLSLSWGKEISLRDFSAAIITWVVLSLA